MDFETINKTLSQPVPKLDYPIAVDKYGHPLDPTTILHMRPAERGEGATSDSIFNSETDRRQLRAVTVHEQLELLYAHGFRGRMIFDVGAHGPHPLAGKEEAKAEARAQAYPQTDCLICTAYIHGKRRMKGYRLLELRQAGQIGCSACSVLYQGITHFARVLGLAYEDWESIVQQRSVDDTMLLSDTRTISVSFCQDDEAIADLEFACMRTSSSTTTPPNSLGRRIADTSAYSTAKLVRGWIEECAAEHRQCAIRRETPLPPRLIEVSNRRVRLVETQGQVGAFLALSHCWGHTQIARTTTSNFEERMQGISWDSLSRTFKDAVMFTWNLGYRYIWIDSLCIIQDDRSDWEVHAAQMSKIFSRAQLTISATRAKDGDKGCFSLRPMEPFEFSHRGRLARKEDVPVVWDDFQTKARDRDGKIKDLSIRAKSWHGVQHSPLLQRAWVFQEQILSPRIIHFGSSELYWECKSYVFCECEGWEKRSESLQMETRRRKAHSQLVDLKPSLRRPLLKAKEQNGNRSFEAYRSLVEQYTATHITQVRDRLPALSGISFGRKDQYLAGIWRSMLLQSLHWISSRDESHCMAHRPSSYCAPTWSWASLEAPIRHVAELSSEYSGYDEAEMTAKVVAASCTPEGLDARGSVSSGYLKLEGPVVRCRAGKFIVRETPWKQQSDTCVELQLHGLSGQCEIDIPLSLARNPPAEMHQGQELTLLRISTRVALALDEARGIPGAYQRVGVFSIEKKEEAEAWFSGNAWTAVFIL